MKRVLLLASGFAALCGVLAVAPGCSTVQGWFLKGAVVSYGQYLSQDQLATPPLTTNNVMKALGTPMAVHDRNGVIRELDYHCYSLNGDLKIATFFFNENQKLVDKNLW